MDYHHVITLYYAEVLDAVTPSDDKVESSVPSHDTTEPDSEKPTYNGPVVISSVEVKSQQPDIEGLISSGTLAVAKLISVITVSIVSLISNACYVCFVCVCHCMCIHENKF